MPGLTSTSLTSLVLLDPKNFTSINRTPWAGNQLASGIKAAFAFEEQQFIGESWEISCDQECPSMIAHKQNLTLSELIVANPIDALSPPLVHAGRHHCDILVKLINASTPLSLQIHPADDNIYLKANECGKPESWLILDATAGSGLYLGFAESMPLKDIESKLKTGTFSKDLLHFVPVKPGDFFEIAPGVPHAIGPGIVLLEPQRITPGKSGKTWRIWDWNRLYNEAGQVDHQGKPRELHVRESLSLLQPEAQVGHKYVNTLRKTPQVEITLGGAQVKIFPANDYYQVLWIDLRSGASITMNPLSGFAAMTMLSGKIQSTSTSTNQQCKIAMGQSAFVPWAALPQKLENVEEKPASFSWIIPAGLGVSNHNGIVFET